MNPLIHHSLLHNEIDVAFDRCTFHDDKDLVGDEDTVLNVHVLSECVPLRVSYANTILVAVVAKGFDVENHN